MARRSYDPELVRIKGISADNNPLNSEVEIRNSLRIPLKRGIASCILMNPSSADDIDSDDTINFVIKYIYQNIPEIDWIRFYNLYPFYESSSPMIYPLIHNLSKSEYSSAMKENRKEIKKTLGSTTHLFLGYGQCSGDANDKSTYYDIETEKLLNMIEKYYKNDIYVFETSQSEDILIKKKYPRHPNPNNKHVAINHHKCQIKNGSIVLI
ncbi:DUF1643 domain-containing protein (plasmid) [Ureibacillus chungkukjangi]|uniref:DUF1643 domain-containing protein n=1 Tax=Ureibacillus chungkukjangi TaxID=1202712 RepID=UPI000D3CFF5B|nr:DUF1643 domain-containing protein [Ureibacillus chungkukjangi]MCM3390569.1 DUF1643 domain-containing protein [Ureibacillus chungkukjangi]